MIFFSRRGFAPAGFLFLRSDLLIHPLEEAVTGNDHPLADVDGGEVLTVEEVVGISDGNVEDLRNVLSVEGHGEVLKGRVTS